MATSALLHAFFSAMNSSHMLYMHDYEIFTSRLHQCARQPKESTYFNADGEVEYKVSIRFVCTFPWSALPAVSCFGLDLLLASFLAGSQKMV